MTVDLMDILKYYPEARYVYAVPKEDYDNGASFTWGIEVTQNVSGVKPPNTLIIEPFIYIPAYGRIYRECDVLWMLISDSKDIERIEDAIRPAWDIEFNFRVSSKPDTSNVWIGNTQTMTAEKSSKFWREEFKDELEEMPYKDTKQIVYYIFRIHGTDHHHTEWDMINKIALGKENRPYTVPPWGYVMWENGNTLKKCIYKYQIETLDATDDDLEYSSNLLKEFEGQPDEIKKRLRPNQELINLDENEDHGSFIVDIN